MGREVRQLIDEMRHALGRIWVASDDFLHAMGLFVLQRRPSIVVECGSGVSTCVLAACLQQNRHGHLYSLEHLPKYAANVRKVLELNRLADQATVIDAPLINYDLNGQPCSWYSLQDLSCNEIDLLIVDGPPNTTGPHARYPAGPLLISQLRRGGSVFLDDAARPDERETLKMWASEFPTLGQQLLDFERGCAVLSSGQGLDLGLCRSDNEAR
jgi:predicted O-methyltransferase YrrM